MTTGIKSGKLCIETKEMKGTVCAMFGKTLHKAGGVFLYPLFILYHDIFFDYFCISVDFYTKKRYNVFGIISFISFRAVGFTLHSPAAHMRRLVRL